MRKIVIQPLSRTVRANGTLTVKGKLTHGYRKLQLALTSPSGEIAQKEVCQGPKFKLPIAFPETGVYKVELLAQSPKEGLRVLANFPIYADLTPPETVELTIGSSEETAHGDPVQQMLLLINEERRRHHLQEVTLDDALGEVALSHSKDMRDNNFVGHLSPTTGDFENRVEAAGIKASLVMENVGRSDTISLVHQGLMDSPGHRAAILSPEVNRVGIGIVRDATIDGGEGDFVVTELFAREAVRIDIGKAPEQLLSLLNKKRRTAGLDAVELDKRLSRIAQSGAQSFFDDSDSKQNRIVKQVGKQFQKQNQPYKRASTVMAVVSVLEEMLDFEVLMDPTLSHVGIGIAQGTRDDTAQNAIAVILVLAWK